MSDVTFVLYSEDAEGARALADLVAKTTHGSVVGTASDVQELEKRVEDLAPFALLALLGDSPHDSLDAVASVQSRVSALYVCGPQDDSSLLLRALKFGAKEYFPLRPALEELEAAIESQVAAASVRNAAPDQRSDANIIAVMGAKGGVGATFVACELTATLQRMAGRAVIVDLNAPLGDVAVHFDLHPRYTLAGILKPQDEVDSTYVSSLLTEHRSGFRVLASAEHVEETELVTGAHVGLVIENLRSQANWITVDVSRSWNDASVRALDLADEIILVTSADVAALAHTRQHLDLLERLGHSESDIHVVANRRSAADAVSDEDFGKFLGRPIDVALPNDYPTALEASNSGRTLHEVAAGAELTLAYERLAREVHDWCGLKMSESDDRNDKSLSGRVRRIFGR